MTRMLYYAGGGDLRRMSDDDLDLVAHNLQQAYATRLHTDTSARGRFSGVGAGGNSGVAYNTERTARYSNGNSVPGTQNAGYKPGNRSGAGGDFPGTGTTTRSTYQFFQQLGGSIGTVNNEFAPLFWNGTALQRSNTTQLETYLFNRVRNSVLSNELGGYRIATTLPGPGWVLVQGSVFRDSIYSNSQTNVWNLYLKTSFVTPPTNNQYPLAWSETFDVMVRRGTGTNEGLIGQYLLPRFLEWAPNNGLRWQVGTSNVGTNRGVFYDRRRNSTNNVQSGDTYTSIPVDGAYNYQPYYFYAS